MADRKTSRRGLARQFVVQIHVEEGRRRIEFRPCLRVGHPDERVAQRA